MSFNYFCKSNITFGCGSVAKLPELIKKHDLHKIMVVYDKGVKAAGIAERVLEQVRKTGVEYIIFDDVIPNPTNQVVEMAYGIARKNETDGFVAVGGGSSIDTAKAISLLMTNSGKI